MKKKPPRCQRIKADGQRCKAKPLPGKKFCTFHDPELAGKRAEGRKRGGKNRSKPAIVLPNGTPELPLKTVVDVVQMLAETVNHVRTGRLEAKVGNCLGVLASVLLKALEQADFETRLANLEAKYIGGGKA